MIQLPLPVKKIMQVMADKGFLAYAVGGCVRDVLLGKHPTDWDLATDASLHQLVELFPTADVISEKYSVVRIAACSVDIATFRSDGAYSDGRRPDSVTFQHSIHEDLARRDFTINAIAWDLEGHWVDPYGGREDLTRKVIRTIGDPRVRFRENPIRLLRAVRLAAEYDFDPDPLTFTSMRRLSGHLTKAGPDRIRTEFLRILNAPYGAKGIGMLERTHLLEPVLGLDAGRIESEMHKALHDLMDRLDSVGRGQEDRLSEFYACFGSQLGKEAIMHLNFDKKTRKRLTAQLPESTTDEHRKEMHHS